MIFAVFDYSRYRRRRGRYSESALRANGLRRASESEFPDWQRYPFGQMLFAHTAESKMSWLVMYMTNSVLSHTALLYGEGMVHDVTTEGVICHSLSDYFDGVSFLGFKDPPPGVDLRRMRAFMDSTLGDGFDWIGVLKFGLHIAIANHIDFAWRLAVDVVLILALLAGLSWLVIPWAGVAILVSLVSYLGIVIINRTWRKRTIQTAFRLPGGGGREP